jgi:hypothetical protein
MTFIVGILSRSLSEQSDLPVVALFSVAGLFVSAVLIRYGIDLATTF